MAKIVPLEEIGSHLDPLRALGKRVVQCHGCFDLLHLGHVRYFRAARSMGDVLVVTITADDFVQKGPGRPVFIEQARAEFVAELACVDFVSIVRDSNACLAIHRVRPNYFAKGGDFTELNDALRLEKTAVESCGGAFVSTQEYRYIRSYDGKEIPFHSSDFLSHSPGFVFKKSRIF